MKFGGSSLADSVRIREVAKIVQNNLNRQPILVLSALGKTTDNLIAAGEAALNGEVRIEQLREFHYNVANELNVATTEIEPLFTELQSLLTGISLLKEISPRAHDYLVSFGERLSVRLVTAYFNSQNVMSKYFDAWDIGMRTNSCYTDAIIEKESYDNIRNNLSHLKENYSFTPVVTGFIAHDANGVITTTGRGGSDLTASVIGSALDVEEVQVWKDVDGLLTTDPRIVAQAQHVSCVSFEQAAELAYFGAKILHPRSILPAMVKSIPVRIKNSYNPSHEGTVIVNNDEGNDLIKSITCKRNICVVDVVSTRMLGQYGFLARVFDVFAELELSVDMVASSEVSVSITLDNIDCFNELQRKLGKIARIEIKRERAIVSVIGNVDKSSEILDTIFGSLKGNGINVQMISQGASKVNMGFVVNESEVEQCIKILHGAFFPASTHEVLQ